MMRVPFVKMHAQGNDFVLVDQRSQQFANWDEASARAVCERRYGVGCDQLLVLEATSGADAHMRIFNNDGSVAANCGNGLRCAGAWLMQRLGKNEVTIGLGDRRAIVERGAHGIRVHMGRIHVVDAAHDHIDLDLGNAHRVVFEATEPLPEDRNIEIVTAQIEDHAWIDIIERGAGRTPACGSGACAAAAAIWHREGRMRPLVIEMPGGRVHVSGSLDAIVLEGPVTHVYDGTVPDLAALLEPSSLT